jgi:cytoskeletal protein CcmA (bactofilin family)
MLKSSAPPPPRALEAASRPETLVGPGSKIEGDLHFSGQLRVEGTIVGNIRGEGTETAAVIGPTGRVEGEIHAGEIQIEGEIRGNVHAQRRLRLGARARLEGDVTYVVLEVNEGANVNGRFVHQGTEARLPARSGGEETSAMR